MGGEEKVGPKEIWPYLIPLPWPGKQGIREEGQVGPWATWPDPFLLLTLPDQVGIGEGRGGRRVQGKALVHEPPDPTLSPMTR